MQFDTFEHVVVYDANLWPSLVVPQKCILFTVLLLFVRVEKSSRGLGRVVTCEGHGVGIVLKQTSDEFARKLLSC